MADDNTGLIIGIVAAGIIAYYFLLRNILDPYGYVANLGKQFAKTVINPAINPANNPVDIGLTAFSGALEGSTIQVIPDTPEGFNPSNWSWAFKDMPGAITGLPADMTRNEFCRASGNTASTALCGYYADLPWYQKLW